MKKLFIFTAVVLLSASTVTFAQTTKQQTNVQQPQFYGAKPPISDVKCPRPPKGPDFKKRNAEFEKRLNLTEEQKKQAEQMREQSFEKMKPVMEKMKEKQITLDSLKDSQADSERAEQLKKEISVLRKQAHEIRMQNMKDFESILDKTQQKELNSIKEEGRKKFEEARKKGDIKEKPVIIPPRYSK